MMVRTLSLLRLLHPLMNKEFYLGNNDPAGMRNDQCVFGVTEGVTDRLLHFRAADGGHFDRDSRDQSVRVLL